MNLLFKIYFDFFYDEGFESKNFGPKMGIVFQVKVRLSLNFWVKVGPRVVGSWVVDLESKLDIQVGVQVRSRSRVLGRGWTLSWWGSKSSIKSRIMVGSQVLSYVDSWIKVEV